MINPRDNRVLAERIQAHVVAKLGGGKHFKAMAAIITEALKHNDLDMFDSRAIAIDHFNLVINQLTRMRDAISTLETYPPELHL